MISHLALFLLINSKHNVLEFMTLELNSINTALGYGGFMRRMINNMLILFLVVVLVGMTGCQDDVGTGANDKIRVGMVPKVIGINYFDKCAEGAQEVADRYGIELIYKGPTSADAASQVNIIQDMVYQGVDVLAVAPVDPDAVKPILTTAREKGIKVVTFDADAAEDSRDIFVNQVAPEVLGAHIMDNLAELLGGDGQYAIMTASMTADNQNTWIEWMKITQDQKYPGLELVTIIPNDEDQQKAYANTRNLLQAYPDLDGIVAMSTVVGPGAAKAVEALGKNSDIKLYVLSMPNDIRTFVESGTVQMATLWDPFELGALTMEVANILVSEGIIQDDELIGNSGPIQYNEADREVIMGDPLDFTIDNIDAYDF